MKYLLPILFLLSGCYSARVGADCTEDTNDICQWSIRSSAWQQNDSSYSDPHTPRHPEINLFVKRGTVLKWFHPGGVTMLFTMLDSYGIGKKWMCYECYPDIWDDTTRRFYRIMVSFDKGEIDVMDWDFKHEKDYLP